MLQDIIFSFIQKNHADLDIIAAKEFCSIVARYLARQLSSKEFRKILRKHTSDVDALNEVKQFFDTNHYLTNFWRAVYGWYQTRDDAIHNRFGISSGDFRFVMQFLPQEYHTIIRLRAKTVYIDPPDSNFKNYIAEKTRKYCEYLAYKKIVFITYNDGAQSFEDMVQELQLVAVNAIDRFGDRVTNREHMLNIAKKCIHHHHIRLIDYNNAQKRRNLTQNDNGSFSKTTVSFDSEFNSNQQNTNSSNNLYNFIKDEHDSIHMFDISESMNKLYNNMDKRTQRVLSILWGIDTDQDFDCWLGRNHSKDRCSLNHSKLLSLACKYQNIPTHYVREKLREAIPNYI